MSEFILPGYMDLGTRELFESYKNGSSELNGMLKNSQTKQMQKQLVFVPNDDTKDCDNTKDFDNTKLLLGIGTSIGAGVTLAVIGIIKWNKNRKQKVFAKAYDKYIKEIQSGIATTETIDALISSLKKLTDKNGKLKLEITPEEFISFVKGIIEITVKMSEVSNVDTSKLNIPENETTVVMFDIQNLLEIQKNLIKDSLGG